MAREWKPGTVAMVSGQDGEETRALRQEGQWATEGRAFFYAHQVKVDRELVVIDPEKDDYPVDRLAALLEVSPARVRAALRGLVTPPKPPEPTGLGAVVLDAEGQRWVRIHSNKTGWWWRNDRGENRRYEHVAVDEIKNGGVTDD